MPKVLPFSRPLRLFTASLFAHAKEKQAKWAQSMQGLGVGFASGASKKKREAVDIFEKKWTY